MAKETPADRRRQTGDGAKTPPGQASSTSQGDREKNSLGDSRFDRRFIRYVANDDGTPIAEETNSLLRELLVVQQAILAALRKE